MRKSIVRSLAIGFLVLVVGLTSFGSIANAKNTNTTKKTKTAHTTKVKKVKATKGKKRTLPGKVVSVNGTTLVMTKGNKTYTVEVVGVTPVNRKGVAITLADIKPEHKVSIRGTVTGLVVTNILKLRDITLPVSTTTDSAE